MYEAAIIDVDGTIVRGDTLLPGATEGLAALEERGIERLLFSNNPTRGAPYYAEKLAGHGVSVDPSNVLTSAAVTADYLAENHGDDAVYLVGSDRLATILTDAGLALTTDPSEADLVVGSIDRSFSYDRLSDALGALERDVPFYGTDPDATIPAEGGAVPGSGAILAALEAVAGRSTDAVLGKPSEIAARAATERLGVDPDRILVVGDRLDTDVALGARAGMTTALVLTGLGDEDDVADAAVEPDHVLDSLADVATILDR